MLFYTTFCLYSAKKEKDKKVDLEISCNDKTNRVTDRQMIDNDK